MDRSSQPAGRGNGSQPQIQNEPRPPFPKQHQEEPGGETTGG